MSMLHELQSRFCAALNSDDPAQVAALLAAPRPGRASGLAVYRNNLREGRCKTLAATYPAIARLVGEACFRSLALQYAREQPSRSGDLNDYGGEFAVLLDGHYLGTGHAYLGDVARLEWAWQQVLAANAAPALGIEALGRIAPADYPRLLLSLHPAARLVSSAYPVLAIWRANRDEHGPDAPIDLDAGPDHLIVHRQGEQAALWRIGASDHAFVSGLANGCCLGDALERVLADDPAFDLRHVLLQLVARGVLGELAVADNPPSAPALARASKCIGGTK